MKLFSSKLILFSLISGSVLTPLNASNTQTFWNPQGEKQKKCSAWSNRFLTAKDGTYTQTKLDKYVQMCIENYDSMKKLKYVSNTKKESKWDENITTKIDVQTFWKQVKETREIKYGKDKGWDKNMDYCSYWSENIALSKGEGLVMSKLIKYADKCMNTLNFMTKYMLDENAEYKE